MKKRFLAAVLLLVVGGGLGWFLLSRYTEREVSLPAWSQKELGPSREPPEVTLAALTESNTVRLAIGALGLAGDQTGRLGDLLTVELKQAKGLELVDRTALNASWAPEPTPPDPEPLGFASDGERLVVGMSLEQIKVTLETRSGPGTDANSRTNIMMTPAEVKRLEADKNSRYVPRATAGNSEYQLGALAVYDLREGHWQPLLPATPLAKPATRVALDGNDIWIGGWSYVAVVDSTRKTVRKISYVPADEINRLQIAGGYLWAQFDKHLYRVPLSATR